MHHGCGRTRVLTPIRSGTWSFKNKTMRAPSQPSPFSPELQTFILTKYDPLLTIVRELNETVQAAEKGTLSSIGDKMYSHAARRTFPFRTSYRPLRGPCQKVANWRYISPRGGARGCSGFVIPALKCSRCFNRDARIEK